MELEAEPTPTDQGQGQGQEQGQGQGQGQGVGPAWTAWPITHPVARALLLRAPSVHGWGGNWSPLVRRELARYYALLRKERDSLYQRLSREEIARLVSLALSAEEDDVMDALAHDPAWATLCPGERLALLDALERSLNR